MGLVVVMFSTKVTKIYIQYKSVIHVVFSQIWIIIVKTSWQMFVNCFLVQCEKKTPNLLTVIPDIEANKSPIWHC